MGGQQESIYQEQQQEQQQQQQQQQKPKKQYTFAQGRRSSIDLSLISDNFHDSNIMDLSGSSSNIVGSGRNLHESLRDASGIMTEAVAEEGDYGDEDSTVNGDDDVERMEK